MASAQFEFQNFKAPEQQQSSLGDLASDFFLGTSNTQNIANMNMLNNQQAFNQHMAQQQMKFQEHMSNTAYQRAVADMQKAGINPMVAAANGSVGSASTPGGSSASSALGKQHGQVFQNGILGAASAKVLHRMFDSAIEALPSFAEAKDFLKDLTKSLV